MYQAWNSAAAAAVVEGPDSADKVELLLQRTERCDAACNSECLEFCLKALQPAAGLLNMLSTGTAAAAVDKVPRVARDREIMTPW